MAGLSYIELHSLKKTDNKMIWVTPIVEGVKLKIELDAGLALAILSYTDYKNNFGKLKLKCT